MKNDALLRWRAASRIELATLLDAATVNDSQALGGNTIYHLSHGKEEVLALALADGQALIIEQNNPPRIRRRRAESVSKRLVKTTAK